MRVLEVVDLSVSFPSALGSVRVVDGVSFAVAAGQTLGLVGETGSGKSMTAQAILRMVPTPGRIDGGQIVLSREDGSIDLAALDPDGPDLQTVRGGEVAMVFQNPASSLSPVHTVSTQLCELLELHRSVTGRQAKRAAIELLRTVGFPDPETHVRDYPHQLSGGMSQRLALALALAGRPRLLIADEPTTALDPVAQLQVVRLIRQLQQDADLAVIFITHDLRLLEQACDQVAVMYAGQVVERAAAGELLRRPLHPYTAALVESSPRLGEGRRRLPTLPGSVGFGGGARPAGCRFVDRCNEASDVCRRLTPRRLESEPGHEVRCHLHDPPKHVRI